MDILGIGPLELLFILVIALIVLGPTDMVKAGRTIGKFLRQVVTSPTWRTITRTSSELRTLPNKLIRDAGMEEDLKEIQKATRGTNLKQDFADWQQDISSWTTPPTIGQEPGESKPSPEEPEVTSENSQEEEAD